MNGKLCFHHVSCHVEYKFYITIAGFSRMCGRIGAILQQTYTQCFVIGNSLSPIAYHTALFSSLMFITSSTQILMKIANVFHTHTVRLILFWHKWLLRE